LNLKKKVGDLFTIPTSL